MKVINAVLALSFFLKNVSSAITGGVDEINEPIGYVSVDLNDEGLGMPLLPGFRSQFPLKKMDVRSASVSSNGDVDAKCALWSDARFEAFVIPGDGDDEFTPEYYTEFKAADRLYCWDANVISEAVMVEDTQRNRELIPLKVLTPISSSTSPIASASWKRPLQVRRAALFGKGFNACRFWSRSAGFSEVFDDGDYSPWTGTFAGATELHCASV